MRNLLMIIVLLITTLLIPITPVSHAAGISSFSDISSKHWAQKEIERLQENNLIGGYSDGTFRPNNPITRAEAVKIIVQTNNIDIEQEATAKSSHSDVPTSYWAFPYIEAAEKHGLITGYADGSFRPVATLTRADSAVLIARAFELSAPSTTATQPNDVSSDHWAASSIDTLISNGVAVGDRDGNFQPSKMVSRSEFAALLARTLYKEFRINSSAVNDLTVQKPKDKDKSVVIPLPLPLPSPIASPIPIPVPLPLPLPSATATATASSLPSPLPSPSPLPTPTPESGLGGLDSRSGPGGLIGPIPPPAPLSTVNSGPVPTPSPSPSAVPLQPEVSELQAEIRDTGLTLSWVNPSDPSIKEVNIYKEGIKVGVTSGVTHEENGLLPSTSYSFTIKTVNTNNHESVGKTMSFTTAIAAPPSSPAGLVATPEDSALLLKWDSSIESNVTGYNVYLNGSQINTTSVTQATYSLGGVTNGKSYNLFVTAVNTFDKESEPSAPLNAVPGLPDVLAPEEVSGFTSINDGKSITMNWVNPLDKDFLRTEVYQHDVLLGGERRDQVERLEHEADLGAAELGELTVLERGQPGVADEDGAAGEAVEAGEAVQQGALARARRAHDRGELPGLERNGHVVEGADLPLAEAVDLDRLHGTGGCGRTGCRGREHVG